MAIISNIRVPKPNQLFHEMIHPFKILAWEIRDTDSCRVHMQIVYKFTCTLLLYTHLMNMDNSFNLKQVIILVYCILFWWQATLLTEPCQQFDLVISFQSRFCVFTDPIMFIHAICLVRRSKFICLFTFIQKHLAVKMYPRLSHRE